MFLITHRLRAGICIILAVNERIETRRIGQGFGDRIICSPDRKNRFAYREYAQTGCCRYNAAVPAPGSVQDIRLHKPTEQEQSAPRYKLTFTMRNLIHELAVSMEVPIVQISEGITLLAESQRAGFSDVRRWVEASADVPDWANKAAARWLLEFWMNERNACEADGLLDIDKKYTRLLQDFSMGEIIEMRNQLAKAQIQEATADP